ncbi:hypothetical protein SAMD00019534_030330 [Acytostelium subglobosum LB1]|uniref:hypothetical protein n=1 Tax=Acytostelium subglobosum LB1 TaxID=1410327 RepID=UPI000644FFE3|nr:hypothetical protein SAMD00019534_030330 [Acytostelium subglobosum LB1]GAM19858.1 hypothetical protein SAMD00019534_030330 [Acytostelium subglobosum LB1]|eukprot:XP_012756620.1 hypothetical protein SAMD00019534_030330 [Acytostelium subglobosum LB1]
MEAVRNDLLDVYKLLETQARELPQDTPPLDIYNISDHLMLALIQGQVSMFNYLLSLETQQSMSNRIQSERYFFNVSRVVPSFHTNNNQKAAMSSILKTLIGYIERHYSNDTSITPFQAFRVLLKDAHPFGLILMCQDIELAEMAIKYVALDGKQLGIYCNAIFDHCSRSKYAPYIPSDYEFDQQELKHTVQFLFALLKFYGRHVDSTEVQFPSCRGALTKFGVLLTDFYVILSSQYASPPLRSYIRRGIFDNIHQDCSDYHEQFIDFYLNQSNGRHQTLIDFNAICTYGTKDMVTIGYDWICKHFDHNIYLHKAYPKSLEILEFLVDKNWYHLDQMAMLVHFISMADPDMLKAFLTEYDINPLFTTDDDGDLHIDGLIDSVGPTEFHPIDKCAIIQSIIQTEFDRQRCPKIFDIISHRIEEMTLQLYQTFSKDGLIRIRFDSPETFLADPAVARYLLSQVVADFDTAIVENAMKSACALGLMECVHLLDSPSKVFSDIRSWEGTMSALLHHAFINGHHSICHYLIGCGARFGGMTFQWVGTMDVATLDTLIDMLEMTNKDKCQVFGYSCLHLNLPLIKRSSRYVGMLLRVDGQVSSFTTVIKHIKRSNLLDRS